MQNWLTRGWPALSRRRSFTKTLLVMKLTSLLLLAACLQVSARGFSQNITYSGSNVPLPTVFSVIEKQTGYNVVYNPDWFDKAKTISVSANNVPVETFLKQTLKDQPFDFTIQNTTIILSRKPVVANSSQEIPVGPPPAFPVSGRVTNGDGSPLSGASVTNKNSKVSVATDADGRFSINANEGEVLVITFVGYGKIEVKITSSTTALVVSSDRQEDLSETDKSNALRQGQSLSLSSGLNIALSQKISSMQEVVINKGYYTEKQKLSVSNVGQVTSKEIERQPVGNPLLTLQGRVPGLVVTQANGLAGGGVTVRIQGQNSLTKGNDPLYVVDGVPYSSQLLPNISSMAFGILGGSGGTSVNGYASGDGNPLSFINPADIDNITVLKDADATAIYGSRAANGAILITTKKGKAGATKIDINLQSGWGRVAKKLDLLNTQQYLQMRHEAKQNDGLVTDATDYDINGLWDTTRNTDWQKELIGGTAKFTRLSTSISGGTSVIQYHVGGTYHRETTVFPGNLSDQKGSVHFNIKSVTSNQKFRFQLSGNYLVDNNKLTDVDLTSTALSLAPNAPSVYNIDGTLNWAPNSSGASTWVNPLSYLNNKYVINTNNLVSNAILGYQIIPGLEISTSFGYTRLQSDDVVIYPLTSTAPENRPFTPRFGFYGNSKIQSWIVEPQLNYKRSIGKGKVDVLIGTTILQNKSKGQQLYGYDHNSDLVISDIASAPSIGVIFTTNSVYKYSAIFSRLNYNLQDKYIVNLTVRRDGSSRFGSANQFHNFGAIGAGWVFSSEKFVQKALPFLSFGKLRGSYGTAGNDQIGDYQFLNLYTPIGGIGNAYQGATGLGINGLPNSHLQWEETKKLQIGIDLGFFNDRLVFNTNYYRNRSSNQLLSLALPNITGFSNIAENFAATVENNGWEFSLNSVNIKTQKFKWVANINLTIPKNKLISFPNLASSSYASSYIVGQPISLVKVYHLIGVDPTTGKYQFADSNGNPTFSPSFSTDRTVLINPDPKFYGGFQNSFSYKGFELELFFQFVKQLGVTNRFGIGPGGAGRFNTNQPVWVLDQWQKPGDQATIQRFSSTSTYSSQFSNANSSDAAWVDASFIRLKNLSFSWQVPTNFKRKAHLQNCRLYIQAQNLLTITDYKMLDPETRKSTGLPPLRVLTFGIQIGL